MKIFKLFNLTEANKLIVQQSFEQNKIEQINQSHKIGKAFKELEALILLCHSVL